jgi:hypothetical protein
MEHSLDIGHPSINALVVSLDGPKTNIEPGRQVMARNS